jgi:hypothetical protein
LSRQRTDRYTASNLILKLFPNAVEGNGREVAAPYINLTLFQSDEVVAPGSRFTAGVNGYKPIQLMMETSQTVAAPALSQSEDSIPACNP